MKEGSRLKELRRKEVRTEEEGERKDGLMSPSRRVKESEEGRKEREKD